MASRILAAASKRFYLGATTIAGKVVIGATGAVGATSLKGVSTVVRDSVGQYTFTLRDSYKNLVFASGFILHTANSNLIMQVESEDVDNATTPVITFQCYDVDDNAAEEIPDGATLFIKLDLSNSKTGIA